MLNRAEQNWPEIQKDTQCSGGCGKVRSVLHTDDPEQWLCYECHTERVAPVQVGAPGSLMRRLYNLPEPQESITRYDVSTNTPWGTAQTAKSYGVGIVQYSTASHGGFHVSSGLLRKMDEDMRGDAYAPLGWFEEDCAWSMVVLSFPERFRLQTRLNALDALRSTYPQQFQRLCRPS